jgi:hypothetical protein
VQRTQAQFIVVNNIMSDAGPRLVCFCDLITGFCHSPKEKKERGKYAFYFLPADGRLPVSIVAGGKIRRFNPATHNS